MTDHDMSWTITETQLASDLVNRNSPRDIRMPGEYSLEYDGDEVVTCFDDNNPDGIGVYGWLYGLSESL